ncbi:hypothetical protein CTZ27_33260 [Streptomyces griseocarneus]|nr:hypothetical protein CTZ27_33260 [Streptomyces griseocarneus]
MNAHGEERQLDFDGTLQTTLWTTAEAAEAAGVSPGVIRIWAHRGHLSRANPGGRTPKYRAIDVVRAERATRERARRTYAA